MSRLVLVRHGRAAAGWGDDLDPGLDQVGQAQAAAAAIALAPIGPLPIVVSPLRRTRETAAPLEAQWGVAAEVQPAVGEVVSPTNDLAERVDWLRRFMQSSWADQPEGLLAWRQGVLDALLALPGDTVVVTHFVAINVVVGHATSDDRVTCFAPDNCSLTVVEAAGGRLSVVQAGAQAETTVL